MIFFKKSLSFLCFIFISFNVFAEPEFELNSGLLTIPMVRVDGALFRNAQVILSGDGTWNLKSIDAPQNTTNPICDIERETARNDALESLTERYSPSFSTIESLLSNYMKAYDEICLMDETPVLLEILNSRAESYYPSFSTILSLTKNDLEALENLQQ